VYYWVVGVELYRNGQPKLVCNKRPFYTELEARRFADEYSSTGKVEVFETRTGSWSTASQEIKGQLVKNRKSLGAATERIYKPGGKASAK